MTSLFTNTGTGSETRAQTRLRKEWRGRERRALYQPDGETEKPVDFSHTPSLDYWILQSVFKGKEDRFKELQKDRFGKFALLLEGELLYSYQDSEYALICF